MPQAESTQEPLGDPASAQFAGSRLLCALAKRWDMAMAQRALIFSSSLTKCLEDVGCHIETETRLFPGLRQATELCKAQQDGHRRLEAKGTGGALHRSRRASKSTRSHTDLLRLIPVLLRKGLLGRATSLHRDHCRRLVLPFLTISYGASSSML